MAVRKSTQSPETTAQTHGAQDTLPNADTKTAEKLSQGLTLVPYWGYSADGRRIACCAWVKLRAGESISQAAGRLTALVRRKE